MNLDNPTTNRCSNLIRCLCATFTAIYDDNIAHSVDHKLREQVVSLQLNIAACENKT